MKIDKAICLCIDKRQKFFQSIENQLNKINIPYKLFIAGTGSLLSNIKYDHIDTNKVSESWTYASGQARINNYNVFLCHQKMIKIAKEEDLNNVLFLEDDFIILSRFNILIDEILNKLNQIEWDCCLLGYHRPSMIQDEQIYQQNKQIAIHKTNDTGGFHGVLINKSAFDKMLALKPTQNMDVLCPKSMITYYSIPRLIFYRNINSNALDEHPDTKYRVYEDFLIEDIKHEF
jgi:hypothetical protein